MNKEFEELLRWVERSPLTYQLIWEAKVESKKFQEKSFQELKGEKFKERSKELFRQNTQDIVDHYKTAFMIINSAASIEELPIPL